MIHARDDYNRIQDPAGKIGEDEPVFLMRAQDDLFLPALRFYQSSAAIEGLHDIADRIQEHLRLAGEWRKTHPTKLPDLPQ